MVLLAELSWVCVRVCVSAGRKFWSRGGDICIHVDLLQRICGLVVNVNTVLRNRHFRVTGYSHLHVKSKQETITSVRQISSLSRVMSTYSGPENTVVSVLCADGVLYLAEAVVSLLISVTSEEPPAYIKASFLISPP